ncbi:YraN family protein [Kallotenue papyrolyticum]|uniref:YraN family protein n=1 Tax=Kallotenue papyrolyticum TaxID=1325125 RepID=UPI0004785A94|nr:YraN family protein [Kallotenue papyrolyticum]
MHDRRVTGQRAETLAALHLQRQGYGIIARNWRCAQGEIDIIATDGATLVFVEVRARRSTRQGTPEESITPAKQRRLIELAAAYLQTLEEQGQPWIGPWRIDVIAVRLAADGSAAVRHLSHAVEAE